MVAATTAEALERRVLLESVVLTPGENLEYVLGDVGDFQLAFDGVSTGHIYGGSTTTPGNGGVVIRLSTGETSGLPAAVAGSAPFDVISAPANDPSPPNGAGQGVVAHFSGAEVNGSAPYEVTQSVSKQFTDGDHFVFVQTTIQNTSAGPLTLDYFVAADLFLGGSDDGTSSFDPATGAVSSLSADERYGLHFIPDSPAPTHHQAGFFADIWQVIAGGGDFADTVNENPNDVAMGLQWSDVVVPFGGTATISYYVSFDETIASQATDEPPAAAGATFGDVRAAGATQQTVQVMWTDQEDIDRATMGDGDVIVTGPDFFAAGVASGPIGDDGGAAGDGAVCNYIINAPAGGFRPGVYTVEVARDQVFDVTGKAVPRQVLGTFEVGAQKLAITPTSDAATLAAALVNGDGITITGTPTFSAPPASGGATTAGTFADPNGTLGLTAGGVVLSTGDVRGAGSGGASRLRSAGKSYGLDATSAENQILGPLTGTGFNQDVSRLDLEFDVAPGVTELQFQIVLATQDQQESGSPADALALLINGENVAVDARNNDAPLSARSGNLRQLSGTAFTGILAPSGDPVIRITVPVDAGSTGNTLTLLLGDADNPTGDTAAYVSAFAGVPPEPPVEFDEAFGGANGAAVDFVTESLVGVGDKTIAVGYDVPGGGGVPRFILERYDAAGALDDTFGTAGRTVTPIGGLGGHAFDVVVAPDGTLYVAGDADGDLAVAHYSADGELDTAFGVDGIASVDLLGADGDVGYAIAIDPATGNLIVAGTAGQAVSGKLARDAAIARFTRFGDPDATFGPGGQGFVTVNAGRDDAAGSVVLSNGGIVVAGNANNRVFVARVDNAGVLDPAFGGGDGIRYLGGSAKTNLLQTTDFTVGLAAQPDGKLLVAASTGGQGGAALEGSDFGLVRLNPDGLLDGNTFGQGALASTDFGGTDDADSIVVLPDGRILVTGSYLVGDTVNTAVAVYEANGAPSTDYALGGRSFFDPADADAALGVASVGPGGMGPQALHIGDITRRIKAAASDGGATVPSFDEGQASILRRLVVDEDPPTAALEPLPDVTINGLPTVSVTVVFTDAFGVDVSDIAAGNLQIVRAGAPALTVTDVIVNLNADGSPRRATYTAAAPGGAWDAGDNGAYAVTLLGGQVTDTSNNAVGETALGSFTVAVVPPPPVPQATLQPVALPADGQTTVPVQVIFTDDNFIDVSTIDVNDLSIVRGGDAPLTIQSVQLDTNTDGSPRVATYTVLAPGGAWDPADGGVYVVSVVANQVGDTDGPPKFVAAGPIGTFGVDGGELIGSLSPSATRFSDTDADGTAFTITLKGGSADVFRVGDAIELRMSGTNAATNLSFKTKGGDGRLKVSGIVADGGLKAVSGKTVDLTGDMALNGPVGKVTLGNVTGAAITVGPGGSAAFTLGQVTDSSLSSESFVKTLKAGPWLDTDGIDDPITAPAGAGAVTIGGDLEGDVLVAALKSLKVSGAISAAAVRASGNVGKVTAGSMAGALLYAGVVNGLGIVPDSADDFANAALSIAGVRVTGLFSNSVIAAGTVGKVTLGTASTNVPFTGVGGDRIAGVTATLVPDGTRLALKKLETPDQTSVTDQFTVRVL